MKNKMELTLTKENIEKGRTSILYSHKPSEAAVAFFNLHLKENIVDEYKNFTDTGTYIRNITFYIDAIYLNENRGEIKSTDLDKLIHFTWKSEYHLMAYTYDKIFQRCNDHYLWEIKDYEKILKINDEISKSLYMFSRWAEKKVKFALMFIIENEKLMLKDINNIPLKGKNRKYTIRTILSIVKDGSENNSSIIKALTFAQKIHLLSSLNISNNLKLFSFNLDIDLLKIDEDDSSKQFSNLIIILNHILAFRNKISHSEFILNRRNLNRFNSLIADFRAHSKVFCSEPNSRLNDLLSELKMVIYNSLSNDENICDEKCKKILSYFGISNV